MTCTLASSVIKSMEYSNEILTLKFTKYTKRYFDVPKEIAYKLTYTREPLQVFNTFIKNKFKNEKL